MSRPAPLSPRQKIDFAKTKSDIVAKKEGTFEPREKKPLPPKPTLPLEERPEAEQLLAKRRGGAQAAESESEGEGSDEEPSAKRAHTEEEAAPAAPAGVMPPPPVMPGYYGVRFG